ncbi:MAG: NAD(P)/FAD-dependent oxidoreductase [Methanobacteriaceae archaeon]
MNKYDVVIIGSGPAGLTSAIYSGRQGSKTLVIDKGLSGGLGLEVPLMENYPGFELIAGMSLVAKMKAQAMKNAEIKEMEEVLSITLTNDTNVNININNTNNTDINDINFNSVDNDYNFEIKSSKSSYYAKTIIIATGSKHRQLNVPGEAEFKGKGVCYCATCDGLLYRDKNVLMVGGGNSALQESLFLKNTGVNVTIVHRRDEFRADDYLQKKVKENGIDIIFNSTVKEIKGNQLIKSVVLSNIVDGTEKEIDVDGIFIAIGDEPLNQLAKDLNCDLDTGNYIRTDKNQRTYINGVVYPYVYSAGDITGGVKQWVVACGEGAVAATSAFDDLNLKN